MLLPGPIPGKRTIAAGWAVVALAYAPAAWLMGAEQGQHASLIGTLVAMIVFFAPWALATPALLRLSTALPLIAGETSRSLSLLALTGIVVIPTLTAVGLGMEWVRDWVSTNRAASSLAQLATGVAITSCFSVPIYCAVMGVGQTLVWVERTRSREGMLARARLDTLRAQVNPHFSSTHLASSPSLRIVTRQPLRSRSRGWRTCCVPRWRPRRPRRRLPRRSQ